MQAILRSRIPSGKRSTLAPTRIEISFPLVGVTELDFFVGGKFSEGMAREYAIAEFGKLFGRDFAAQAMPRRAVWSMEVI